MILFKNYFVICALFCLIFMSKAQETNDSPNPCGLWETYEDKKCILLIKESKSFDEAMQMCHQLGPTSTLLSIHSEAELHFMGKIIFEDHEITGAVWLGAKFNRSGQLISTDYGGEVGYTYWARGFPKDVKPDRRCIQMIQSHYVNVQCDKKNLFVCQKLQIWPTDKLQHTVLHLLKMLNKNKEELNEKLEKINKDLENLKMVEEKTKKDLDEAKEKLTEVEVVLEKVNEENAKINQAKQESKKFQGEIETPMELADNSGQTNLTLLSALLVNLASFCLIKLFFLN